VASTPRSAETAGRHAGGQAVGSLQLLRDPGELEVHCQLPPLGAPPVEAVAGASLAAGDPELDPIRPDPCEVPTAKAARARVAPADATSEPVSRGAGCGSPARPDL